MERPESEKQITEPVEYVPTALDRFAKFRTESRLHEPMKPSLEVRLRAVSETPEDEVWYFVNNGLYYLGKFMYDNGYYSDNCWCKRLYFICDWIWICGVNKQHAISTYHNQSYLILIISIVILQLTYVRLVVWIRKVNRQRLPTEVIRQLQKQLQQEVQQGTLRTPSVNPRQIKSKTI